MKKDVSLRCWNKNTDSHAKTVSTKKWNRHISRDVERRIIENRPRFSRPILISDLLEEELTQEELERYMQLQEQWSAALEAARNSDTFSFRYYNQDHLGNNREVVDEAGNILQVTNYYPFGTPYCDGVSTINPDTQPFKYNGKELDMMHGMDTYDYGARQYNSILSTWDRVDPMAEKYYHISPYVYCLDNPVNHIDYMGMAPDSLEAALMSGHVYGDKMSYVYMKLLKVRGWNLEKSYNTDITGFKSNIYKRINKDGHIEYACAFAGTDVNHGVLEFLKDVVTDVQNFIGFISPQYVQAIELALKISGKSELTFTGHSLGGGLAAISSMYTGHPAITFNPASVTGFLRSLGICFHGVKNITQYRTVGNNCKYVGDPVNIFQNMTGKPSQGKVKFVNVNTNFSHGIADIINAFLKK